MADQVLATLAECNAAEEAAHAAHLVYIAALRDPKTPLVDLQAASVALGAAHDRYMDAFNAWAADFEARYGYPPFPTPSVQEGV
jgi:hypothetical protein